MTTVEPRPPVGPTAAAAPSVGAASDVTVAACRHAPRDDRAPSPQTERLYASGWNAFTNWCRAAGASPLPAAPDTVVAYLDSLTGRLSYGALARRLTAIADRHRRHGLAAPTADPAVAAILRAARRGATPRRAPPRRPAQLVRLAAACPGDLAGTRDRALLLLLSAGLDRATLVGLDVEWLGFRTGALDIAVDAAGAADLMRRLTVSADADPRLCPVQALRDWLALSDTRFGPVFRKIDRWGNIEHESLGPDAIRRVLARRTRRRRRPTATT